MQAIEGKQKSARISLKESMVLSDRLMKEGYDIYTSAVDQDGYVTIIWPACTNVGKQLDEKEI